MTLTQWSAAVAIFAVGGMVGALLGPFIANVVGRLVYRWCYISMSLVGTLHY